MLVVSAYEQGQSRQLLLRSTDGGRTWRPVASQTGPNGSTASFLAFTTDAVGTWVGPDDSVSWRTTDGGATWRPYRVR